MDVWTMYALLVAGLIVGGLITGYIEWDAPPDIDKYWWRKKKVPANKDEDKAK